MKKTLFITHYITILNLHAKRLVDAITILLPLMPLTEQKLATLPSVESAYLEVIYSRFGKMQDAIATKIFPFILSKTSEFNDQTIIDKLNRLEKLGYLNDAQWWLELREIRNKIAHDYDDDYDSIATDTNHLIKKANELIVFWEELKKKLTPLL